MTRFLDFGVFEYPSTVFKKRIPCLNSVKIGIPSPTSYAKQAAINALSCM
jgi:hypothetical protein